MIDELEERQNEHKNIMMLFMEEAGVLLSDSGRFTFKKSKDGTKTNWNKLDDDLGYSAADLARFTKDKQGHRSFRPPQRKKG